jgi:hypothetical protein
MVLVLLLDDDDDDDDGTMCAVVFVGNEKGYLHTGFVPNNETNDFSILCGHVGVPPSDNGVSLAL